MAVQQLDLPREYGFFKKEIDDAVARVLASGRFILGEEVSLLEKEVATYCGAEHGVGVASGTDALHLALRTLDLKPGQEVILPSFTFIATAEAVAYCGATPVFADIDPHTLNLDPNKVEEAITPKTRAILPVHLFGLPAPMRELTELAEMKDLVLVEDAAQAFGASLEDKKVGNLGDLACFSFFPTKNLNAYGDGGMVLTSSEELAQRLRSLRNHGSVERHLHKEVGLNSRLDELQAAILRVKLPHIDWLNAQRRAVAQAYSRALEEVVEVPLEPKGYYHVYHQYTIRTLHRDALLSHLREKGIGCQVYYPLPIHMQEPFKGYPRGPLEETEKAAKEVLSLPIHPFLTPAEVEEVIQTVLSFF
ncbi:MAG TPA: DegT/DnrJ/EryC1/StrS family aminotransferase [Thermosulfidibacter takaii]|uniref:DegT/DnrJ/EryC1/StrS family aminotransferase n=1 Tax=Thermosulfidibacter takaii TaxID=412593 RepID=A0A7C0Y5W3_9BACT|nr:DegT/DnrJ/EryC1/StrS family aminotransferase [Thermosulfidibacter takaii]